MYLWTKGETPFWSILVTLGYHSGDVQPTRGKNSCYSLLASVPRIGGSLEYCQAL